MLVLIVTMLSLLLVAISTMGRVGGLVDDADQNMERLKDGVNGQTN